MTVGKWRDFDTGEQESGWIGRTATPTIRPQVARESKIARPPALPPDPTADVSATWSVRVTGKNRPFSRGNLSLISFVPDQQGPALAWTKSQWQQPSVLLGRQSRITYVTDLPLPPQWLGIRTPKTIVAFPRQSLVANVLLRPEGPAQSFAAVPTKQMQYRRSLISQGTDFESEDLLAIPIVTVTGRMPIVRPGRSASALVLEPVTVDLLEAPGVLRTPPTFLRQWWWPATRLAWCPQTIIRNLRDDRDDLGTSTRSQMSTGGSGRNKTSTGVATQG